ncbi:MAG: hypothetical protein WBO35_04595 [Candidatus Saccharimonadales bacterium]
MRKTPKGRKATGGATPGRLHQGNDPTGCHDEQRQGVRKAHPQTRQDVRRPVQNPTDARDQNGTDPDEGQATRNAQAPQQEARDQERTYKMKHGVLL